jgi:hypothetical protein
MFPLHRRTTTAFPKCGTISWRPIRIAPRAGGSPKTGWAIEVRERREEVVRGRKTSL